MRSLPNRRRCERRFVTPLGDHVHVVRLYQLGLRRVDESITLYCPKPLAEISGVRDTPRRSA